MPPSADEVRNGNDHVGVLFASEVTPSQTDAFTSAAERWSNVVAGTPIVGGTVPIGFDPCQFSPFTDSFVLDHLLIIASVNFIDGPSGILGQAGPCTVDPNNPLSLFPIIGIMNFDEDDVANLEADGIFEAVILHEMGHVLGIGSLWSLSTQGTINLLDDNPLLINPVFTPGTADLTGNVNPPEFIGVNAVGEFNALGGVGNVPVEDGIGSNAEGPGSIDSHWKITALGDELMVFAIGAASLSPLSVVTIGSLEDMGYSVDFTQADAYTLPTVVASKKHKESSMFYLMNDVMNVPLVTLPSI